jgi:exodeoxyribonuclease-3
MITVATWNINSVKVRLPLLLQWLEKHQPDLVFLQEIKCVTEKFPVQELLEAGYHATVHGQPAYNGVAILSRQPVELIANILPGDDSDDKARFLDISWHGCRFINIYAPNGNPIGTEKFSYKLQWLDRLQVYLQNLLDLRQKFIIGGDFNIIPENIDAKHPEEWRHDALFQPESRRKWRSLQHLGLTDAFRALHPTQQDAFSFWDYQAGSWHRDNGIRIDHFLLSPGLADQLHSCHIDKEPRDQEKPSDHTPVVVSFKL